MTAAFLPEEYRVLITGGTGMLGRALRPREAYMDQDVEFIKVGSKDYDLRIMDQTLAMFNKYRPHAVIHLAARVGGVKANTKHVADFYLENILINTNVLSAAQMFGAKKVVSLLSSCIYPDGPNDCLYEEDLHKGEPHESNFGYAYAKRMLEVQSRAYNQQYPEQNGWTRFSCLIPTNMYGPHDNFDLENGHVIPAIIRKIYEAKESGKIPVFWGSGTPLRQFAHVDDVARIISAAAVYNTPPLMNIGFHEEHSIKFVVDQVARFMEYYGPIEWDSSQPEGQYRKTIRCWKMYDFCKDFDINAQAICLQDGLRKTCKWFEENYPNIRGINGEAA